VNARKRPENLLERTESYLDCLGFLERCYPTIRLGRETEPDGLRFDPDAGIAERITEDADYEVVGVSFVAYHERARISIQVDIGFGDVVTPPPRSCSRSWAGGG